MKKKKDFSLIIVAIVVSILLFYCYSNSIAAEINQKYSYSSFMGQDLRHIAAKKFNNSIIIGSCFYQEANPDTHIFPEDMTGVVFQKCNLDNVYIPAGNTVDSSNCHRNIKVQNDREDWILNNDLTPKEPMNKIKYIELGLSIAPNDIPKEKMDKNIITKKEKEIMEVEKAIILNEGGFMSIRLLVGMLVAGLLAVFGFKKLKSKAMIFFLIFFIPSICFSAAADMYVTVAGAGTKDGLTWANAFGLAEWTTDLAAAEAGDNYFIQEGTYTLVGALGSANDGTVAAPISVIGVVTATSAEPPTIADWATGENRPRIVAAANNTEFDNGWLFRNIRVETTQDKGFRADIDSAFFNVYGLNTSATANRSALYVGGGAVRIIDCEGESTAGYGIRIAGNDILIFGCYAHDSNVGIELGYDNAMIMFSVVDTNTTYGISLTDEHTIYIANNTIYNSATGIYSLVSSNKCVVINNIIDTCTTKGISWTTSNPGSNWFDYNNYNGNTGGDTNNVTKGPNATAVDPTFTDAAAGNFTIGTNLKAAAFPGAFPGGLSTGYLDTGAVQRVEAAAGGTGGATGFMIIH